MVVWLFFFLSFISLRCWRILSCYLPDLIDVHIHLWGEITEVTTLGRRHAKTAAPFRKQSLGRDQPASQPANPPIPLSCWPAVRRAGVGIRKPGLGIVVGIVVGTGLDWTGYSYSSGTGNINTCPKPNTAVRKPTNLVLSRSPILSYPSICSTSRARVL